MISNSRSLIELVKLSAAEVQCLRCICRTNSSSRSIQSVEMFDHFVVKLIASTVTI